MQWSSEKNAGFSDAHPDELPAPVVDEGAFSYDRVNVRDQEFDPNSMFNWMQRLVHVRRENPEFGWGEFELVETSEPSVLAHRCTREEGDVMAIHNLADEAVPVSFSPSDVASAVDLFANRRYDPLDGDAFEFTVDPYGYRWLRLRDGE